METYIYLHCERQTYCSDEIWPNERQTWISGRQGAERSVLNAHAAIFATVPQLVGSFPICLGNAGREGPGSDSLSLYRPLEEKAAVTLQFACLRP